MRAPYYANGGDVIGPKGWLRDANLAAEFIDLECRHESALAAGRTATAAWLELQIRSLTEATTKAARWRNAGAYLNRRAA